MNAVTKSKGWRARARVSGWVGGGVGVGGWVGVGGCGFVGGWVVECAVEETGRRASGHALTGK